MNNQLRSPDLNTIQDMACRQNLSVFGAFHPQPDDKAPPGTGTLLLLGPKEPGFWHKFSHSPEFLDNKPNPLDRWSLRVIKRLAQQFGGTAVFPFGAPPHAPFISWAKRSGRAWASPVGLLVHDTAGLFLSYRGAIALNCRLTLPQPALSPCLSCAAQPCLTTCPVTALSASGYNLEACHGHLDKQAGQDCLENGCAVRIACPVSKIYERQAVQSKFHMKSFHP